MAKELYNTKFIVINMTEIITNDNQLHARYIVIGYKRQDSSSESTKNLGLTKDIKDL
jgi:hypothetical protein